MARRNRDVPRGGRAGGRCSPGQGQQGRSPSKIGVGVSAPGARRGQGLQVRGQRQQEGHEGQKRPQRNTTRDGA
jgi:hypothetical protein